MRIPDHDAEAGRLERCQITGSTNLFGVIDLGNQPPCNSLLTKESINEPETYYPLRLMLCPESGLAQLDYVVDGSTIFHKAYPYRSGVSRPLEDYLKSFSDDILKDYPMPKGSLAVDIGSNDGMLLSGFRRRGMQVMGVEPTNVAQFAVKQTKIPTIQEFFTEDVANTIVSDHGKAHVITMTNVFAHMATLGEVMRGVKRLIHKDGIFITESQYLLDVLEGNQFDQIYHEHIRLYSLKSLVTLFPYYGMEVFDVRRMHAREGSIRAYVALKGSRPIHPRVGELLKHERDKKLFSPATWADWRARVERCRDQFITLAHRARHRGQRLVADSCPGRGAVLVKYYGIDKTLMPYISQLPTSEKVGKFMPGTHIPIVDNRIIMREKPDYILVLAWHYGDYIMKRWRARGLKSKFILPLPAFKVIGPG